MNRNCIVKQQGEDFHILEELIDPKDKHWKIGVRK
jgi:hypothetical protein